MARFWSSIIIARSSCNRPRLVLRRKKRFPKKTRPNRFSTYRPTPPSTRFHNATTHNNPQPHLTTTTVRDHPKPPQPPQLFTMLATTLGRRRKIQRMQVATSIAIYRNQYLSNSPVRTSIVPAEFSPKRSSSQTPLGRCAQRLAIVPVPKRLLIKRPLQRPFLPRPGLRGR